MSIPSNLKTIRLKAGITQDEFGQLFGVKRSTVANYENGQALPSTEFLLKVSMFASITIGQLCYDRLTSDDLPEKLIVTEIEDPEQLYKSQRNLYDIRNLVKEVKRIREELEQLKKGK